MCGPEPMRLLAREALCPIYTNVIPGTYRSTQIDNTSFSYIAHDDALGDAGAVDERAVQYVPVGSVEHLSQEVHHTELTTHELVLMVSHRLQKGRSM